VHESAVGTNRRLEIGRACPLCPGISDINLFRYCQGECAHPEGHQRIVRQVRVGFRGWNSSSMDCFGSLIRERSLRSFFCASSFCRKRKRGDRVACPDRPCLVMPKPFWPPCVTWSPTKAVRLISCLLATGPSSMRFAESTSRNRISTLRISPARKSPARFR